MNIIMVSSEVVPFAKTGGLADVTGALPKALKKLGCSISVFMPMYKGFGINKYNLKKISNKGGLKVPIANKVVMGDISAGSIIKGVAIYFIENDKYFNRPNLYGDEKGDYLDNAERFAFFSRGVLEAARYLNLKADIIHCNDWQTALIPVYLKTIYKNDPFYKKTRTVFTIHNIGYQGIFWHYDMDLISLSWDLFHPEGIEYYGKINLLKGGLVFSDYITTVSNTYSKEIQAREYGHGLEGVIKKRDKYVLGINNGIDYSIWDPETDPLIKKRYSKEDVRGKVECKRDILNYFGLIYKKDTPLIGIISRLVDQKGFDLIDKIISELLNMNIQMVVLGTGDLKYIDLLNDMTAKFPDKLGAKIGFDDKLAHQIEAGSDIFLMPSKYEPCGLNQMYSLKYGTIPVVRATGGLNDTIKEFRPASCKGNGFKFKDYVPKNLLRAIKKAVKTFDNKELWRELVSNAMNENHSWDKSAKRYLRLYKKVIKEGMG